MGKIFRLVFIVLLWQIISTPVDAQITKIMGRVIDAETKEPVLFAHVYFKGKQIGVSTDFNGDFSIETKAVIDSIFISYVGYISQARKITPNIFQSLTIELIPDKILLKEVVILPGENPAEVLLKKIIKNKENNNRKEFDAYQYEVYTKMQFDANNFNEKLKDRRIMQQFQFVFDYVDTSTINGKPYLPLLISEVISDVYYCKKPKGEIEIIKASNISGFDNKSITQLIGDLYQNVNIYDNYFTIFEKNFVSPIANFGLVFYKYYLVDSAFIGNKWCYHIMFKPRRKQELTFTGNFWVHDTSFAIKKVDMLAVDDANVNFVNDMAIRQEYDLIEGKYWMLTKDYILVDFNIVEDSKRTLGFFGHRTTSYKNFIIDQPKEKKFYNSPVDVILEKEAMDKSEEFWMEARHEKLTEKEQGIYNMVDSVKKVPVFNTYVDIIYMIVNGYLLWGNFELGPYMEVLSFNTIEGTRMRFGGRTSNKFSTKLMLEGHVAYGTKDQTFKCGLGFIYMLSKNPRRNFGGSYLYDIEQLGKSQDAFSEDNLFSALFRRNPATKLSMVEEFKGYYEHEWFTGFSNRINLIHRTLFPVGGKTLQINENGQNIDENSIVTSEIRLDTRFAYKEKYLIGEFERINLGTKYPVLEIQYGYGIPGFLGSEYQYNRLQVGLKQWFNVFSLGWSKYIFETGKIWGVLPYPLLKLMPGNETYIFEQYAFNLMDYYEFISDAYISFYYTHHFDGFILNRIPLMRKLRWRTVVHARGVMGKLSEENKNYSEFPQITSNFEKPYYEAGVGIENIFKLFRIDAIWRLTHHNTKQSDNFAVFISIWFSF
ncbi:MAG: carboxypeptidase-like regulatory domain-containing protein [Bacteroidetes bacterium]|nr:carboxypeptidase-like regulatory domain-containing protein [Bacteroidota bacterium]